MMNWGSDEYSSGFENGGSIKPPVYTWKCELMPEVYWMREEGNQPNAFHRLMQYLVFGFKWEKVKEHEE